MPTLALIMKRTAAAFGIRVRHIGTRRPVSPIAREAQAVFAYLSTHLTDVPDHVVGQKIGLNVQDVGQLISQVEDWICDDYSVQGRLDLLGLEVRAEALTLARLKLPLPADPDPAHTAARLLAGGASAATVSEDALRGLALAFLASVDAAAGEPSTPAQEAENHG